MINVGCFKGGTVFVYVADPPMFLVGVQLAL